MTIENCLIDLSKKFTPNNVLDIGAHQGNFSMFCQNLWKDVDCFMLEGNENCEEYLEKLPFSHCIVLLLGILGDICRAPKIQNIIIVVLK